MPIGKPLLDALDRMGFGGIVLDSIGQVMMMNHVAMRLCQNSPKIEGLCNVDWKRNLQSILSSYATRDVTTNEDTWMVIRRDDTGARPIVLHATPIADDGPFSSRVVIVIVDLEATLRPAPDVIQKIFGLTPAESKLAIEIASGKSLDDVADNTGITLGTVRKQLASVFAKTHTHRQAELVALLARVSILP